MVGLRQNIWGRCLMLVEKVLGGGYKEQINQYYLGTKRCKLSKYDELTIDKSTGIARK